MDGVQARPAADDRILVPLDGSDLAEQALQYAILMPGKWIRLIAVEPVHLSAARDRWIRKEPSPWGVWPTNRAEAYLKLISDLYRDAGKTFEVVVSSGDPRKRIVEQSANADMVVMATRGAGATTALFGSVADAVATHSAKPVMLIRDDVIHEYPPVILRILVPLDGSKSAEEALPPALALRNELNAVIHLIRVVDPATSLEASNCLVRVAAAYLAGHIHQMGLDPAYTGYQVPLGSPSERLLGALRPGDLVMLAARPHAHLSRLVFGSTAMTIVKHASTPVALVPERAEHIVRPPFAPSGSLPFSP